MGAIWTDERRLGAWLEVELAALDAHAHRVCSPGVEVFFHGASDKHYAKRAPTDVLKYPYAKHLIQTEAIDFARRAEAEGFDGVL